MVQTPAARGVGVAREVINTVMLCAAAGPHCMIVIIVIQIVSTAGHFIVTCVARGHNMVIASKILWPKCANWK